MGFAAADSAFCDIAGVDKIVIVNKDHPITQGFPEEVTVCNPPSKLMSGPLEGDVDILAVRTDDPEEVTIGVYEKGAETLTGETQTRHITLFAYEWPNINDVGWELAVVYVEMALDSGQTQ